LLFKDVATGVRVQAVCVLSPLLVDNLVNVVLKMEPADQAQGQGQMLHAFVDASPQLSVL